MRINFRCKKCGRVFVQEEETHFCPFCGGNDIEKLNETIKKETGHNKKVKSKVHGIKFLILLFFICSSVFVWLKFFVRDPDTVIMQKDSSDYVDMYYEDAVNELEELGFTNVTTNNKEDLTNTFLYEDGAVETVRIDGHMSFRKHDTFSKDAKVIVVYHTLIPEPEPSEEPIPDPATDNIIQLLISASEFKKMSYEEAYEYLTQVGFTNIETPVALKDLKNGKNDGIVASVSIAGDSTFKKNAQFNSNSVIRITYHSLSNVPDDTDGMVKVPLSASECKKYSATEVCQKLEDAGFTGVPTFEYSIIPFYDLLTKDNQVKEVSLSGNTKFKKGDYFEEDAKIVITLHRKKK